jgi:O-acetyl-ADP-ribose deacetylase (regulator of RNase III)
MLEFTNGDILKAEVEALVNTVNCVGVMGRGIALQFKNKFPENFKAYAAACRRRTVEPGSMFVFETGTLPYPHFIVNFPTKRHWRGKSRIEDIEAGLVDLAAVIRKRDITSVAVPPLGSGLGGLDWHEVRGRIEKTLMLPGVRVIIYEPAGAPQSDVMAHAAEVPVMTASRAAMVELMRRYTAGLLDPFVTLLEVHKLMYFLQESGEKLRLRYSTALYGPYADNLRHVFNAIEGYFISGYADGGDRPDKEMQLVPGAIKDAERELQKHPDTRERFERVADLVNGFESSFGLELLATVHWVVKKEHAETMEDVIRRTYAWNARKKQFSERQIGIAVSVLTQKGWIAPLRG